MSLRAIYATCILVCFALGLTAGYFRWGRIDDPELDRLRGIADQVTRELAESQGAISAARDTNRELAATNRELEDALGRAEHRNQELTGNLRAAEESLREASGEATEITELLDSIISILGDLFEGSGGGDW